MYGKTTVNVGATKIAQCAVHVYIVVCANVLTMMNDIVTIFYNFRFFRLRIFMKYS